MLEHLFHPLKKGESQRLASDLPAIRAPFCRTAAARLASGVDVRRSVPCTARNGTSSDANQTGEKEGRIDGATERGAVIPPGFTLT
jgi:hypothetical protein